MWTIWNQLNVLGARTELYWRDEWAFEEKQKEEMKCLEPDLYCDAVCNYT